MRGRLLGALRRGRRERQRPSPLRCATCGETYALGGHGPLEPQHEFRPLLPSPELVEEHWRRR